MDTSSGNLIASLVNEARHGRISLQSSPESAKDYIHIEDVTERLTHIALGAKSACYNVASGRQMHHSEWLEQLSTLTGCEISTTPDAQKTTRRAR